MAVQTILSNLKTPAVVVHASRRKGRRHPRRPESSAQLGSTPSPVVLVVPTAAGRLDPIDPPVVMPVATMLHAVKSLAVFKVLAGFYFVSLFVQVLYYTQIQQALQGASDEPLRGQGAFVPDSPLSFFLRSFASHQQPRLPIESIGAISQDLSVLTSDRTLSIGEDRLRRRRHQEGERGNDLRFGLERIKTDDWHHLENYEAPRTDPDLPALAAVPPREPDSGNLRRSGAAGDRRIVYFVHIRSSAGASMCYAARANGRSTPPYQCDPESAAQPSSEEEDGASYDFVSRPSLTPELMDKERYRYVTMLRNSQDRYRSQWKSVVFHHPDQFSFPEWWDRQPDNWNVRALCGARCSHVPKFQITRELFQYALDRLNQFDSVLLAEEFNATFATFAREVGWTRMPVPAAPLVNSARSQAHQLPYAPFKRSWDPHMSVLDDALYEHAAAIVGGDRNHQPSDAAVGAINEYFAKGPARRCLTPCCHDQCSPAE